MKKLLLALTAASALTLSAAPAIAEDSNDVAALTCAEFLQAEQQMKLGMIFWADGYLSAATGDTSISGEWILTLAQKVTEGCSASGDAKFLDVVKASILQE